MPWILVSGFSSVSANLLLHLRLRPMYRDEIDRLATPNADRPSRRTLTRVRAHG